MFDIKYNISILPNLPGVYMMKDFESKIIYVGKAKDLKRRVSQYFQNFQSHSEKTKVLVNNISEFEYIITQNEVEALILENNLIKKYTPRYNILLKDDKTYPFIKVTTNEDFPRVFSTKNYVKDGNLYFGPFASGSAVNDIINTIKNIFSIRSCKILIKSGVISCKPCVYYQIKKCDAPCYNLISKKDYGKIVKDVIDVLSGKNKHKLIKNLEEQMNFYSENLDYEKAILVREKIFNISSVFEKQRIFLGNYGLEDYINIFKDGNYACVQVFFVRDGRVVGRDHFILENVKDDTLEIMTGQFIKSFYGGTAKIPNYIYCPNFFDRDNIEKWMNIRSGKKVKFITPKKGDKKKLYDLVGVNAKMMLKRFSLRKISNFIDNNNEYLSELANILNIRSNLHRIEAYDVSNIMGFDSVGSMVVFTNGLPHNTEYRRFRINNVDRSNDYESIKQVVYRRFYRGIKEANCINEQEIQDKVGKFHIFPDLVLIDGGRGHVNVIEELFNEMDLNIPVCGMVKDDKHRTRGIIYKNVEIDVNINSIVMKFITRVQDEVHRYAVAYHRTLRDKRGFASILSEIPNIGSKRRKELLLYFKNIDSIKNASLEELMKVPSMDIRSSYSLIEFFKNNK